MLRRLLCIIVCVLLTMFFMVGSCFPAEGGSETKATPETPPEAKIDPLAGRLLKEMGDFLKSAKEFSFHAEITYDEPVPPDGKIQYSATGEFAARRPDKLYFEFSGDRGGRRLWYDGKNITVLDAVQNVYGVLPAEPQSEAALDSLMKRHKWSIPLSELFTKDPHRTLMSRIKEGYYVGLHHVDGVRCHHLVFIQDRVDWQIWIEDGTRLVPRKVTITYKTVSSSPQYTAVLSDWELNAHLPDVVFSALLPKDAERIDFLKTVPEDTRKP
jgi:hypothetical protein